MEYLNRKEKEKDKRKRKKEKKFKKKIIHSMVALSEKMS